MWFDHALDARQMSWQLAAVGITGAFRATCLAFDNRLGLFLRGVQHALSDFDIFKRKIVLIGCQLFGLRTELLSKRLADPLLPL